MVPIISDKDEKTAARLLPQLNDFSHTEVAITAQEGQIPAFIAFVNGNLPGNRHKIVHPDRYITRAL
jgi:hypothetical protein